MSQQREVTAGGTLDGTLTVMSQRLDTLERAAMGNHTGIQQLSLDVQTLNANVERVLGSMKSTEEQLRRVRRSWTYRLDPSKQATTTSSPSFVDRIIDGFEASGRPSRR
jgi:ElaB/YqjD/DUF883 family membrane-anchored ribosome-binding protein